jgi:ankyrin repeat protein
MQAIALQTALEADDIVALRKWIDTVIEDETGINNKLSGATPLILAAKAGSVKCLQVLIEAGAALNATDDRSYTALHWSADLANVVVAQQLLATCECEDLITLNGKTALDLALDHKEENSKEHADMATLLELASCVAPSNKPETLVKKMISVPTTTAAGTTEIQCTVIKIPVLQMIFGNYTVRIVNEKGGTEDRDMKLQQNGNDGQHYKIMGQLTGPRFSLVHIAASNGDDVMLEALLEVGCDMDTQQEGDSTPLWLAVDGGHIKSVKLLLDAGGIEINPQPDSSAGDVLLQGLGMHKKQFLLTAYQWLWMDESVAMWGGQREIWEVKHMTTPLVLAAAQGNLDMMQLLIAAGADIEAPAQGGVRALWLVAVQGFDDCLKVFIDKGADVNCTADDGVTPLIGSARLGSTACVQLLLDAGATVNAIENVRCLTALHEASLNGHKTVLLQLLSTRCCVDHVNIKGQSARDLALESKHREVAQLLQAAGAVAPYCEPNSLLNRSVVVMDRQGKEWLGWVVSVISSWTSGHTHSILFVHQNTADDVKLLKDKNKGERYALHRVLEPIIADPRFDPSLDQVHTIHYTLYTTHYTHTHCTLYTIHIHTIHIHTIYTDT